MNNRETTDFSALEADLRQALAARAEAITPNDRWREITMTTDTHHPSRRRWPMVLLAAAAVLAIIVGVFALRPQGNPTPVPAETSSPSPTATDASPEPSASPTPEPSQSEDGEDAAPFEGVVPVYYIALEARGYPESGLGLRRTWVPAQTPDTPQARAKAALVDAMNRPLETEGQIRPWEGTSLSNITVGTDRIDIALTSGPTAQITPEIGALAVQQLVWTAQAAVGLGNIPVHFSTAENATTLWATDITQGLTRSASAEHYAILTDLWITEPSAPDDGVAMTPAGQAFTVHGQASVFEANVQWQLLDASGTVVDEGFTTASIGAPERGTFEFTVTAPTTPGEYTLKAFSLSMKDGQGELANDRVTLDLR